jgi:3-polyprenyl-4-hydroxybenzoate decarboxylase
VSASPPPPPSSRLIRKGFVRVVDHRRTITVVGDDRLVRRFDEESTPLVRTVLELLLEPRTPSELLAEVQRRAGDDSVAVAPILDELLGVLRGAGVVIDAPATATVASARPAPTARAVLGLTGAVASVHAAALVQALMARGFVVRVVMTEAATRFASIEGLRAITHQPVFSSLWPTDLSNPVPHINLAEWADVVVVCPASATTLSRLARGDFSDLVSAVCLATRAPVVLAPSMNPAMVFAPAVQRNLAQLADDGFHLVHPGLGLEVAHRPEQRHPLFGPAPPPELVADLVALVHRERAVTQAPAAPPSAAAAATGPRLLSAAEWDHLYRTSPPAQLPWFTEELDADLAAGLEQVTRELGPRLRLLDVGTGTGVVALAAARLGHAVVATDLSPAALARAAAGSSQVTWVQDDILDSRLFGAFDVVVDRGCFHLLPVADRPRYVDTVARLLRPGGRVLLKVHAADEPRDRGAHRLSAAEVTTSFGPRFRPAGGALSGLFGGPGTDLPRSLLCALERLP